MAAKEAEVDEWRAKEQERGAQEVRESIWETIPERIEN